MPTDEDDD